MRYDTRYRMLVMATFFVLLMFGVYIGFNFNSKRNTAHDGSDIIKPVVGNTEKEENVKIYDDDLYDVEVVYITHYVLCNEDVIEEKIVSNTNLEKIKDKVISDQDGYKLENEVGTKLTFSRQIQENCPKHFEIKIEDEMVVVYKVITDDKLEKDEVLDVSVKSIRKELYDELEKGVRVDSIKELNLIIEDLES